MLWQLRASFRLLATEEFLKHFPKKGPINLLLRVMLSYTGLMYGFWDDTEEAPAVRYLPRAHMQRDQEIVRFLPRKRAHRTRSNRTYSFTQLGETSRRKELLA